MNDMSSRAADAPTEIDRLLRDFYRAQMPKPWPRPRLRRPASVPSRAPRFSRNRLRLALAASVVLALLAYWTVAGMFSQDDAARPGIRGDEIGNRLPPVKHLAPVEQTRTPGGNDARVFEENTPGGQVITIIGPATSKGPR